MIIVQRNDDLQQRIFAASAGPVDPLLFWHMFDPEHIPGESIDDNGVYFPTDEAGFDAMIAEWEAADLAAQEGRDIQRPFFETLGFRKD